MIVDGSNGIAAVVVRLRRFRYRLRFAELTGLFTFLTLATTISRDKSKSSSSLESSTVVLVGSMVVTIVVVDVVVVDDISAVKFSYRIDGLIIAAKPAILLTAKPSFIDKTKTNEGKIKVVDEKIHFLQLPFSLVREI